MLSLILRPRRLQTVALDARQRGLYVPAALLRVERALRSWPVPAVPKPYIPYSFIPASRELVVWWYFLRYTGFLLPSLDAILRPVYGPILILGTCVTGALIGWFWDSRVRRRLPMTLRLLAWAGHTAQTLTYLWDVVKRLNLYDCIFLVAIVALFEAVWDSNWPIDRGSLRAVAGPLTRKQAPYLANWGSQALWVALQARRSPFLYFVCFPLLLNFATLSAVTFFQSIDLIDDRQRLKALGAGANTRNPAARIPPEVQLQIFRHVKTSMRFRAEERPCNSSAYYEPNAQTLPEMFKPGLPATCSVCRAWHDAATEVLYVDVRLANARCTHVLARTLSAHPALARFVRSIVFPYAVAREPRVVEQIVRHCVDATRISFFRTEVSIYDVPGLSFAAQHVRTLAINGGHHGAGPYTPPEFNMSSVLAVFPNLEALTLSRQNVLFTYEGLRPETAQVLGSLRSLRLDSCSLQFAMIVRLLGSLPRLQTVELRNMSLKGGRLCDASALFFAQRNSLRELLLASTVRSASTASLVCLCAIHGLSALRTVAVNAHELPQIRALPPALEQLLVSFSSYSAWQRRSACRGSVLSAVHEIRALAPSAPALHSVRISDEVRLSQIPAWNVAAFILREMLKPARVDVEVDLYLYWEDLRWIRMRMHAERFLYAFNG